MSDTPKPGGPERGPDAPTEAASEASRTAASAAYASASASGHATSAASTAATSEAGTTTGGAAAGADVVTGLEARIKELESQQADLTDRLLRAHAEMDNLRKRTEREKADTARYAITKFATDIVGISDNFQRAVDAVPSGAADQDPALKSLVEGVLMSERAFLQVLEGHGVRRLDPKGETFDPNRHQAVMEEHNAEVPAGTVLKVFQAGYMIEERVLRPAMVVVSRGGAKSAPKAAPGNDNGAR